MLIAHRPLITRNDLSVLVTAQPATDPSLNDLLTLPLETAVRSLERHLITRALTRTQGNKAEAARLLGIHRQSLYLKLKELEIGNHNG